MLKLVNYWVWVYEYGIIFLYLQCETLKTNKKVMNYDEMIDGIVYSCTIHSSLFGTSHWLYVFERRDGGNNPTDTNGSICVDDIGNREVEVYRDGYILDNLDRCDIRVASKNEAALLFNYLNR